MSAYSEQYDDEVGLTPMKREWVAPEFRVLPTDGTKAANSPVNDGQQYPSDTS